MSDRYGFHRDEDGFWWLIQGTEVQSAVNLPPEVCPFSPSRARISATSLKLTGERPGATLPVTPVTDYFLPQPAENPKPLYIRCPTEKMGTAVTRLQQLQAMQWLRIPASFPIWTGKRIGSALLAMHNNFVTPIIFGSGIDGDPHIRQALELALALNMRVCFIGPNHPDTFNAASFDEVSVDEIPDNLPSRDVMRALGAYHAYTFMRGAYKETPHGRSDAQTGSDRGSSDADLQPTPRPGERSGDGQDTDSMRLHALPVGHTADQDDLAATEELDVQEPPRAD